MIIGLNEFIANFLMYIKFKFIDKNIKIPNLSPVISFNVYELLNKYNIGKKFIIFSPNSNFKTKKWNINNWIKLRKLVSNEYKIIFIGQNSDKKRIEKIANKTDVCLINKLNTLETIKLFSNASAIICNQSYYSKIANNLANLNVITINTSSEIRSEETNILHKQYSGFLECQPCNSFICKNIKKNLCTKYPKPEIIAEKLENMLNGENIYAQNK